MFGREGKATSQPRDPQTELPLVDELPLQQQVQEQSSVQRIAKERPARAKHNPTLPTPTKNNNPKPEAAPVATTALSSPTQIPGTWFWMESGYAHAFGQKTDGTLWGWGHNDNGQLGQNNRTDYSSPVQVGSGTDWSVVSNSYGDTMIAIKTDGTMWGCGAGTNGALAQGSAAKDSFSSPIQITGTTWRNVTGSISSALHFLATKTDGTLWGWGENDAGSLGNNESANRKSSPVQVPGTDWYGVSVQKGRIFATKQI